MTRGTYTGEAAEATIQLYMKQAEDSGKTPVVIDEMESRAMEMSAALSLRQSGLPYYPVREREPDGRSPGVRIEFTPPRTERSIERVGEIPATLTFLDPGGEDDPSRKPEAFRARIMANGESCVLLEIVHTGDLDMDGDDLADLIFDACLDGSVDENETHGWEDLNARIEQVRETASHAAACVLKGPEEAMEDIMEKCLARFHPGPVPWPGNPARAQVNIPGHGTLVLAYEPDTWSWSAGEEEPR